MPNRIADPSVYTAKTTLTGAEYLHSNDANQDRIFQVSKITDYAKTVLFPADFVSGLKLIWNSGTSITVTSGAAYIQGLGRYSNLSANFTLSGLSLAATTWYHLYLYEAAGTPTIECVTTGPSSIYYGVARAKSGDTTRRYIGSVRTGATGAVLKFMHHPESNQILYNAGPANAVLANGTATTSTAISCSPYAPVTSTAVIGRFVNAGSSSSALSISDGDQDPNVNSFFAIAGGVSLSLVTVVPLNASQVLNYATSASGGSAYAQVCGYYYER